MSHQSLWRSLNAFHLFTLNEGSERHLSRPFTLKVECECVLSRLPGHSKWTFGRDVCSTMNFKRRVCVYCV